MTATSKYFLTLDVGTTSVKISLFDLSGRMVRTSLKEYTLLAPSKDTVELNPETYWDRCKEGLKEVVCGAGVPKEDIVTIGACTQGETLITLDQRNKPVRNAIVWLDNRSREEAEEIKSRIGVVKEMGQPDVHPTWTAAKILWMKKHEPELFKKVEKFLLVEDFLVHKLSGEFAGDYALYTSSYMLDIVNKQWHRGIVDLLGIGPKKLSVLGESGRIVGTLRKEVAEELDLSPKTMVVSGAMDLTAALVGSGGIETGSATEITGAAEVFCKTVDKFPAHSVGTMAVQYHAVPDNYLLVGWCNSGGMTLKWLRDTFFAREKTEAEEQNIDAYDLMTEMAKTVPIGCEGLTFFPYLSGAGTLPIDPDARGVFWGIEIHHTRAHFVRAVMESLAFVLRNGLEEMSGISGGGSEVRILGGGARSGFWNRIKADVTGSGVTTMECSESASLGVAVLHSLAAGYYSSFREAAETMVRSAETVEPNPRNREASEEAYSRFVDLEKRHFNKRDGSG